MTAGYLTHDPETGRFALPAEHAPALAEEGGPFFFGGAYQMLLALANLHDPLTDAFRRGGGVPQAAYDDGFWEGMERFTAGWFNNLLLQEWLPAMPDVPARLARGAELADVGCGRGQALVRLAEAFPASRFVGYDVFAPSIEVARRVPPRQAWRIGSDSKSGTLRRGYGASSTSSRPSTLSTTRAIRSD